MTRYLVYLETGGDGRSMAHVPALPGCFARAAGHDEALERTPDAIRETLAWLRRHGEPAPAFEEPIEIEVAGESSDGVGPFDPCGTAALLPPDLEPLTLEEMEHAFRLLAHSRADLLALAQDLPDEVLNWQPDPHSFSICRVLRHVGNAEEWYVSRLVAPESLPPEWEHDEDMPLFEFLEMERRTAIERLRRLTGEERAAVFHPTRWTDHPEEAWTARKALRRFLEHEREHVGQVREVLVARRDALLAHLAAERASLLWHIVGLEEQALTEQAALGGWTVKDLLAHIAAWDRWEARTMRCVLAGGEPDFSAVTNVDAVNAAIVAEWRNRTLAEVLAELEDTRADWVAWLRSVPIEAFFRQRFGPDADWHFPGCVNVQWQHDAEHAAQIKTWRENAGLKSSAGPKEILLAAFAAAREALLTTAACIPPEERASRPVCGHWTLKDVLGHVADWEWVGVEGLRRMAAGQPPQVEPIADLDAWNQAHCEARRAQPWDEVWADLHAARAALLETLEGMDQAALARSFPFPWGPEGTPYQWVSIYVSHDREHARDLKWM